MVRLTRNPRLRLGRRDESGAVAVLVAILMLVLLACAAVVVDLGNARDVRRQSQNASDASVLAAANALYPTSGICGSGGPMPCIGDAVAKAKSYASQNFRVTAADWAACSAPVGQALPYVPPGETSCISFDSSSSTKVVRVLMPTRTVATFFGWTAGSSSIPVGSTADATLGSSIRCSLCFLGSIDSGNGDFSVFGGSVAVNGSIDAGPNGVWTATSNGVVGTVSGGQFNPSPTTIPAFTDPLATSLTLPLSLVGLSARSNPCTDGPGIYAADVNLPNGTCTLQPGLYVVRGTWGAKNNTVLNGTGVTLYAQSPDGFLDFKNGTVNLTAPTTGALKNYAVIYDRSNTNNLSLQGNGGTSITGLVYTPSSKLDFNGNSCFGFSGGPVIALGVVKANGNGSCVNVLNASETTVTKTPQHLSR